MILEIYVTVTIIFVWNLAIALHKYSSFDRCTHKQFPFVVCVASVYQYRILFHHDTSTCLGLDWKHCNQVYLHPLWCGAFDGKVTLTDVHTKGFHYVCSLCGFSIPVQFHMTLV